MKKNVSIFTAVFSAVFTLSSCITPLKVNAEPKNWFQVMTGYNVNENRPSVRIEGKSKFPFGLNLYGFCDFDGKQKDADLEGFYSEFKADYSWNWFGFGAEYQSSTGLEDLVRAGFVITPHIGSDTFMQFSIYPIDTTSKNPRLETYLNQNLGKGFSFDLLAKYNFNYQTKQNNLYSEFGAYWNFFDNFSIGSHIRMLFDFENNFNQLMELGIIKYEF